MKKIINMALGLIVAALGFTACDDDDNNQSRNVFSIDRTEVTLGADGGKETVNVSYDGEWVAKSTAPWVSISPANGTGNTECVIVVDSTMSDKVRQSEIIFQSTDMQPQKLSVSQTGYGKSIGVAEESVELKATEAYSKRFIDVKVTTNIPFTYEITDAEGVKADWVYIHDRKQLDIDLDRKYRPRTTTVRFDWKVNTAETQRVAHIKLMPADMTADAEATTATVVLTQASAPVITDDRAGDSLAILLIEENLNCMTKRDATENMRNWETVKLWERNDKEIADGTVPQEAIGRVRRAEFTLFDTKDGLPHELNKLKYLETLVIFSNVNNAWKNFPNNDVPEEPMEAVYNLRYLKSLTVSAYGLVESAVTQNMADHLGSRLEFLDLSVSNFNSLPSTITPANYPKLKGLNLGGCRRWTLSNLMDKNNPTQYPDGIGMNFNTGETQALNTLLLWENLEALNLSYNYIEGELPDFEDGTVPVWSEENKLGTDPKTGMDSIQWAIGHRLPRILPNCKSLRLNLNFFTGKAPEWLLYHPRLLSWGPSILIFNQMEGGKDSSGKVVHFDNDPGEDYSYYSVAYPGIGKKYEYKETITDEEENNKK